MNNRPKRILLRKRTPWEKFWRYILELFRWVLTCPAAFIYETINRVLYIFKYMKYSKREIWTGMIQIIIILICWYVTIFTLNVSAEHGRMVSVVILLITMTVGNFLHEKVQSLIAGTAEYGLNAMFWTTLFTLIGMLKS